MCPVPCGTACPKPASFYMSLSVLPAQPVCCCHCGRLTHWAWIYSLTRRNATVFSNLPPNMAKIRACSGNTRVKFWRITSWSVLSVSICFVSTCSFVTVYVMTHASFACAECVQQTVKGYVHGQPTSVDQRALKTSL